jgi:predicted Zn-dependent protease
VRSVRRRATRPARSTSRLRREEVVYMKCSFPFWVPLQRPVIGIAVALAVVACQQAPVTGRWQVMAVPESTETQTGLQAYQEIKQESKISHNPELNERIQLVGSRIARVSPHPEWAWEFTLFENNEPNAFALPGGKVGVHTGLFKVARNDDQLAAVMGHEIAHAIARHGA